MCTDKLRLIVAATQHVLRRSNIATNRASRVGNIPGRWHNPSRYVSRGHRMTLLIAGLVIFLGMHSISIVSDSGRDALAARFGEFGWKLVYGVVSLVGLYLIVKGYAAARLEPTLVWVPPTWTRHLAALLMLPIFVFFFASYLPGRISTALKHPQLVAVKLWAAAHLLANGMLHDMILFGAFLAWAVVDRISMKRRTERPRPQAPKSGANDVIAVVLGLAAYAGFALWAHQAWIGVNPFG